MRRISIMKHFVNVYEDTMLSEGFSRKGNVFHRLTSGKIIQELGVNRYKHRNEYSIMYHIGPLCCGTETEHFIEGDTISDFLRRDTWMYDREGEDTTMYETLELTKQYLLPHFNTVTDYKSYLNDKVSRIQIKYCNIHWDYCIVNLALGNYEDALAAMEAKLIWNRQGSLAHNPYAIEQTEKLQKMYDGVKEALHIGNTGYIEALVKEKEDFSLKSYQAYYGVSNSS